MNRRKKRYVAKLNRFFASCRERHAHLNRGYLIRHGLLPYVFYPVKSLLFKQWIRGKVGKTKYGNYETLARQFRLSPQQVHLGRSLPASRYGRIIKGMK